MRAVGVERRAMGWEVGFMIRDSVSGGVAIVRRASLMGWRRRDELLKMLLLLRRRSRCVRHVT